MSLWSIFWPILPPPRDGIDSYRLFCCKVDGRPSPYVSLRNPGQNGIDQIRTQCGHLQSDGAPDPPRIDVVVLVGGKVAHADDLSPRLGIKLSQYCVGYSIDALANTNQAHLDGPLRAVSATDPNT